MYLHIYEQLIFFIRAISRFASFLKYAGSYDMSTCFITLNEWEGLCLVRNTTPKDPLPIVLIIW